MDANDTTLCVAIGLGSNEALPAGPDGAGPAPAGAGRGPDAGGRDPRARVLEETLPRLVAADLELLAASALHESDPVGVGPEHGAYLNACALVRTPIGPHSLLQRCEELERLAGRKGKGQLAPRPLDLDLIAAWDERSRPVRLREPRLTLPHPRLARRAFVLVPLLEVLPAELAGAPLLEGRTARRLLADLLAEPEAGRLGAGPPSPVFPSRRTVKP